MTFWNSTNQWFIGCLKVPKQYDLVFVQMFYLELSETLWCRLPQILGLKYKVKILMLPFCGKMYVMENNCWVHCGNNTFHAFYPIQITVELKRWGLRVVLSFAVLGFELITLQSETSWFKLWDVPALKADSWTEIVSFNGTCSLFQTQSTSFINHPTVFSSLSLRVNPWIFDI